MNYTTENTQLEMYDIKMENSGLIDMEWIYLTQDVDQWRARVL